jgi:hypothetical protein
MSPTAYRASFPPASSYALIPTCILRANGRPQRSTFREDVPGGARLASVATVQSTKEHR